LILQLTIDQAFSLALVYLQLQHHDVFFYLDAFSYSSRDSTITLLNNKIPEASLLSSWKSSLANPLAFSFLALMVHRLRIYCAGREKPFSLGIHLAHVYKEYPKNLNM